MIASETRYLRRRPAGIYFHITRSKLTRIAHTLASGAACLIFFGGLCCLMGLMQ